MFQLSAEGSQNSLAGGESRKSCSRMATMLSLILFPGATAWLRVKSNVAFPDGSDSVDSSSGPVMRRGTGSGFGACGVGSARTSTDGTSRPAGALTVRPVPELGTMLQVSVVASKWSTLATTTCRWSALELPL